MKDALGAVHAPEWGGVGARVPAPQPAHGRGPPWRGGRLGLAWRPSEDTRRSWPV